MLSSKIMLLTVFLPINANRCGAMTCTTHHRVLQELFVVKFHSYFTAEASYPYIKLLLLLFNHCQWCFHKKNSFKWNMNIISPCFEWNTICLFYFLFVVVHAHNFVEISGLLPRIPIVVALNMFPLEHVFFMLAICQFMHGAWPALQGYAYWPAPHGICSEK